MRRILTIAVAALAVAGGGAAIAPQSALAVHESICINAINSGMYNVITGSGTIRGTNADDVIIGSEGPDDIRGGNGNDVICGRGGGDYIDGGNGNDDLLGDRGGAEPGVDGVIGTGDEEDLLPEEYGPDGVGGADVIRGGNGNDRLWGDEANDDLDGGNGDDQLRGGAGDDWLDGRNGADLMDGMAGAADSCEGGNGVDTATNCEMMNRVP